MQILGGLLILPDSDHLPIPWWYRSVLGLKDRTTVFLAVIRDNSRPVNNLLLSTLDPNFFHLATEIKLKYQETPGAILKILDLVKSPINIALAEHVTLEEGALCQSTLILEPSQTGSSEDISAYKNSLNILCENLKKISIKIDRKQSIRDKPLKIISCHPCKVENGVINDESWMENIILDRENHNQVDLTKMVLSSNTERRFLRCIFPRKGVLEIRIISKDSPGVLKAIVQVITDQKLNILSSYLGRGGNVPANCSMETFICEPIQGKTYPLDFKKDLETRFKKLDPSLLITVNQNSFSEGVSAWELLDPKRPGQLNVSIPEILRPGYIKLLKKSTNGNRIFLSSRIFGPKEEFQNRIMKHVQNALTDRGWQYIDGLPDPNDSPQVGYIEVLTRMWSCRACLVIALGHGKNEGDHCLSFDDVIDCTLSLSQAHEYGFMDGQGRPTKILVMRGFDRDVSNSFGNISGNTLITHAKDNDAAFDENLDNSVYSRVSNWISCL